MATKQDLEEWILESIEQLGGAGSVVQVSEIVWKNHKTQLEGSGDLFFTWQYDLRWAAQRMRDAGKLRSFKDGARGKWTLP